MEKRQFPLIVEREEDGSYVVECPILRGCYTQGKTLDEAMKNIQEVIALCLEDEKNRDFAKGYHPREMSLHMITI